MYRCHSAAFRRLDLGEIPLVRLWCTGGIAGEMEEDHLQDIQKLQTFLTQPVSGGKQLTVQIEDVPIHHQRLQAPVPIRHI